MLMMEQEDAFSSVPIQPLLTISLVFVIISLSTALFLAHIIQFVQLTLIIVGEIHIITAAHTYAQLLLGTPMEIMLPKPARLTAQLDLMLTTTLGQELASQFALVITMCKE
jgi:hypothetical protein